MIDRYLSIWEISHRWHDVSPDIAAPSNIPLNVQDAIRYICRGVLDGQINLLEIVVMKPKEESNNPRTELNQFRVSNPPAEIENCLYRKYDKNALESYFIECENFFDYCLNEQAKHSNGLSVQLDFPSCWWPLISTRSSSVEESENPETPQAQPKSPTLRPSNIHKLICQAIAKTLWDTHPEMTIVAMTEHKAILEHGSGKYYPGKNTLRDWLSEIAPGDVKKPGRPKNSKPNNDAT